VPACPTTHASGATSADGRLGAVSFIHRFGSSLGPCPFPLLYIDGVFERAENRSGVCDAVRFRPAAELTPQAIAIICEQVRVRVLRWFARGGLIDSDDVRETFAWENSGFLMEMKRFSGRSSDRVLPLRVDCGAGIASGIASGGESDPQGGAHAPRDVATPLSDGLRSAGLFLACVNCFTGEFGWGDHLIRGGATARLPWGRVRVTVPARHRTGRPTMREERRME